MSLTEEQEAPPTSTPTPTPVDTGGLSISAHIRKRLVEGGETMSSAQIVAEYGASNSLLSVLLKAMRAEGHKFEKIPLGGGNKGYRFTGMGKPQTNAKGDTIAGDSSNGNSTKGRRAKAGSLKEHVVRFLDKHPDKVLATEAIMKGTGLTLKQVWQGLHSVAGDPGLADRLTKVKRGYYTWASSNLPVLSDRAEEIEEEDGDRPIPHPSLYDHLRVSMMGRDEETGTLTFAVRNDEMIWLCEVVGVQEAEPPAPPSRRARTNGARGRG